MAVLMKLLEQMGEMLVELRASRLDERERRAEERKWRAEESEWRRAVFGRLAAVEERVAAQQTQLEGTYASVVRTIAEQPVIEAKSRRAVIENWPEMNDASVQATNMLDDLNEVSEAISNAGFSAFLVEGNEAIRRHGEKRGQRSRPIKVAFTSVEKRDDFIRAFRRALPDYLQKRRPTITVRRDLMPAELDLHYKLKNECFEMNEKAGRIEYYYQDLQIKKCVLRNGATYKPLRNMRGANSVNDTTVPMLPRNARVINDAPLASIANIDVNTVPPLVASTPVVSH